MDKKKYRFLKNNLYGFIWSEVAELGPGVLKWSSGMLRHPPQVLLQVSLKSPVFPPIRLRSLYPKQPPYIFNFLRACLTKHLLVPHSFCPRDIL